MTVARPSIAALKGPRYVLALVVVIAAAAAASQAPAPTGSHTFTQVAPGVYSAVGTAASFAGSNSAVIVNENDVIVVDSHMTPESGRALLKDLKSITDKPVRLLINTHFHYDHANGNQIFAPVADIIGHEYTRRRLTPEILQKGMFADLLANLPRQIEQGKARAAAEPDAAAKARLEQQLRSQTSFAEQLRETKPTPPNITLQDHVTIYRGAREIQLLHFGRGHTAGDVVVYLPKERVVCTGDLLVNQVANLVDGYVNDWPAALERLRALDYVDVIPGHGEPFKGKERIDWFEAYLRDIWQQTKALHDAGVPADEAARRVDMTAHKAHYPAINGPGVPVAGVTRIYAVLDGRAE